MAKRGAREGSVYHRKDGRWCASYQVALGANGARRRTYVYGTTQADVLEKLSKIRGESASGVIADPGRLKLGEYLTRWLDESARPRVRPATYNIYAGLIRLHIAPRLGGVKMKALAPVHIQALHREIEKVGGSPRKRQMVHAMLRVALRDACRLGILPRNPCDGVARPRAPKPEIRPLDVAETRMLLKASAGEPLEYALAVGSGLRLGELLGLTWRDVDLEVGAIQVRRQLTEDVHTGKLELAEPKTARSRRRLELPAFSVEALFRHRQALGATPHPERLVFTDGAGGPIRRSNLQRRSFEPLLTRAGLRKIRFHDLRHSAATLLLAQGVHPKVVQERLGHSTITLTLDTYSHVLEGMQHDAATKLDAILG